MIDLARFSVFVFTIAFALYVASTPSAMQRRGRVARFIAFFFTLYLAAGLLRLDAWPFTRYPMLMYVGSPRTELSEIVIRGVDARGVEHPIDPFSWSPLFPTALQSWIDRHLAQLTPAQRSDAVAFLLMEAEDSRRRINRGEAIGSSRWLGSFAAPPDWGLYRRYRVGEAYSGLRIYRAHWSVADPYKRMTLLAEYRSR
ncbi:MAG TPA: hypothetical protein VER58_00785 [Thermoanaerobaculia bacterium]|nr:hypothetical protein [Thermoanaerobaculia bacterium]